MRRPARTSLLAVVAVAGALLGAPAASAAPVDGRPLFEEGPTTNARFVSPLNVTSSGIVFEDFPGVPSIRTPDGEVTTVDEFYETQRWFKGNLIGTVKDNGQVVWRTVTDPEHRTYNPPDDMWSIRGTSTGFVALRGGGPYQIIAKNFLDGGSVTAVGRTATRFDYLLPTNGGVLAAERGGELRYFPYSSPGTGREVVKPDRDDVCWFATRSHAFCGDQAGAWYRLSLTTGAVSRHSQPITDIVETSRGVAYLVRSTDYTRTALWTWDSTAASPEIRLSSSTDLDRHSLSTAPGGAVVVARKGALGYQGLWSVPLPSGTPTLLMAAPAIPRRSSSVALSPGSVSWSDNAGAGGSVWMQDRTDDDVTGEPRLVARPAGGPVRASAGRIAYGANRYTATMGAIYGSYESDGPRLAEGDQVTKVDPGVVALSGDRLLSRKGDSYPWLLRDLRTGEVTSLPAARTYDLWGERLVRFEVNGRITLSDLRTGGDPVELRPAGQYTYDGSVHVAGDYVAWHVYNASGTFLNEVAVRDVATMAPATVLDWTIYDLDDLSTGYLLGKKSCTQACSGPGIVMSLPSGSIVADDAWYEAVDGNVVAGYPEIHGTIPTVGTLPPYADPPRLLGAVDASPLAGPGRTWTARVVASRVLSDCSITVRDADDIVVRTLDCRDPHAAATVRWDGTDGSADPLAPGTYDWQLTGATGAEDLVDYDGTTTALSGTLTVPAEGPPAVTLTPTDDAHAVTQGSNVLATFGEPVDGVSGSTFRLRDQDGALVPAAVTYDAGTRRATLNPAAALLPDTRYTATVTGGPSAIRGSAGGPIDTTTWTFTTGPPPALATQIPPANGVAAPPDRNVSATFSEPVTGVDADTVRLTRLSDGTPIPAAVSYNGTTRTVTLNPSEDLASDTRYTMTLTGGSDGITDLAGNPLTTRAWSFTTGPAPTVSSTSPASSATKVSRYANLAATFDEPVTGVSGTTVKLTTSSGTSVTAAVGLSSTGRSVTINPSSTLTASTKYTVTLTGGTTAIRDKAGNPLTTRTWSFTTGA